MKAGTKTHSRDGACVGLAQRAAHGIVARLSHGWGPRVEIDQVVRDLGVELTNREKLQAPARWYHSAPSCEPASPRLWPVETGTDHVEVRAGLRTATRRFAIAHELGHVVLHRDYQTLAGSLSGKETERFANVFAAELLLPPKLRATARTRFRELTDPADLLRLADALGVPARTIWRFARQERWLRGRNVIWLDVRCMPNRHTRRDRRLRIYDVVLDRQRWFLPTNRSVAGVFGSDRWLSDAANAEVRAEATMEMSSCAKGPGPRFPRIAQEVSVRALRLNRSAPTPGLEVIVVARPIAPVPTPASAL